jgi:FMN reductase
MRRIAVVSAGVAEPSMSRLLADRIGAATDDELRRRGIDTDVRIVELRGLAHDLVDATLTGLAMGALPPAIEAVAGADGLIAVTPLLNASYSGLFKAFFDAIDGDLLVGKPVLIGAAGPTPAHALALEYVVRPLFAQLHSVVVPTAVYAGPDDWAGETPEPSLILRIGRGAAEFADQIEHTPAAGATDPFAFTSSLEELLAGA